MRDSRAVITLALAVGMLLALVPAIGIYWGMPVEWVEHVSEVEHDRPYLPQAKFDRDHELVWFKDWKPQLWLLPESRGVVLVSIYGLVRVDVDGRVHRPRLERDTRRLLWKRAPGTAVVYQSNGTVVDFGSSPVVETALTRREVEDDAGFRSLYDQADRVAYFGLSERHVPLALMRVGGTWLEVPLPDPGRLRGMAGPNTYDGLPQKHEPLVPLVDPVTHVRSDLLESGDRRGRYRKYPPEPRGRVGWLSLSTDDDPGRLEPVRFVHVRDRKGWGYEQGTLHWEPSWQPLPFFQWTQRYFGHMELDLVLDDGATLRFWEEGERSKYGRWHSTVVWLQAPPEHREAFPLSFLSTPSGVHLIRPARGLPTE